MTIGQPPSPRPILQSAPGKGIANLIKASNGGAGEGAGAAGHTGDGTQPPSAHQRPAPKAAAQTPRSRRWPPSASCTTNCVAPAQSGVRDWVWLADGRVYLQCLCRGIESEGCGGFNAAILCSFAGCSRAHPPATASKGPRLKGVLYLRD